MHPSFCHLINPHLDLPSPSLPDLVSPSTTSGSCFTFEEEEEHSSTLSTLCFDDGQSITLDDIIMDCNLSGGSYMESNTVDDIVMDCNLSGGSYMESNTVDGGRAPVIMPDYLSDYCWHPAVADSSPITHDQDMASFNLWGDDNWLDATQIYQFHFNHYDESPLSSGGSHSSTLTCTSMSPKHCSGSFTDAPAAYSGSAPATDNICLQSSPYSEASSFAIAGNPPQLDLEASNNATGATTNTEAVAFQVKCNDPNLLDGYVWRKYGQKNIKGRRFPRSYYRCAQPNCPIRKQTESSSEMEGYGLITYFGKHNH